MKRTVTLIAGLTLASGAGFAQQQQTQEYDPDRDITTETERDRGTGVDQPRSDSPVQSEYGTETEEYGTESERDYERAPETERDPTRTTERDYDTETQTGQTGQQERMTGQQDQPGQAGQHKKSDITAMSAEKLSGKSIVSADGEEIGEINEVGYSSTHQDRVATVEVGGFLGVGEKRIAIPLSELEQSETEEDALKTSMTRQEIESEEEFDETGFDIGQ